MRGARGACGVVGAGIVGHRVRLSNQCVAAQDHRAVEREVFKQGEIGVGERAVGGVDAGEQSHDVTGQQDRRERQLPGIQWLLTARVSVRIVGGVVRVPGAAAVEDLANEHGGGGDREGGPVERSGVAGGGSDAEALVNDFEDTGAGRLDEFACGLRQSLVERAIGEWVVRDLLYEPREQVRDGTVHDLCYPRGSVRILDLEFDIERSGEAHRVDCADIRHRMRQRVVATSCYGE